MDVGWCEVHLAIGTTIHDGRIGHVVGNMFHHSENILLVGLFYDLIVNFKMWRRLFSLVSRSHFSGVYRGVTKLYMRIMGMCDQEHFTNESMSEEKLSSQ